MEEKLTMSLREIDRIKVIHDIFEHRVTWREAAERLFVTERQVGRICARVRIEGDGGIIHGLRGQPSNHRLESELLEKALKIVKERYADFGPTFANEKLLEEHKIHLSVFSLRRGMIRDGLWKAAKGGQKHRAWRERRASVGGLVQLDGSDHDWFEGRGPRCVLVIYIDDATSRILYGEFVKVEDTLTLLSTTKKYLEQYGRPVAFYVDKDSIYRINRAPSVAEELEGESEAMTQFRRAMGELGIEMIFAHSPQAKGRVERGFRTHQDRLVKELRLAEISTIEAANPFLWERYIPGHNRRYAVEPANRMDAHRALPSALRLDEILSVRDERTVAQDFTVRWRNQYFQILEEQSVRVRAESKVEVEQRLDETIHLRFRERYLNFKRLGERPYRAYYAGRAKPTCISSVSHPYRPPQSHPWKGRSYRRMLWRKARKLTSRLAA